MVDRVQWGTIFMESHGPRGNHYWFSQQGQGGAIMDRDNRRLPGSRPTVKVESYDLASRPGTRDRDKELSDRLHAMAGSLIERGLLVHPDVIAGQQEAARARVRAREDAERAERRKGDLAKVRPLIAGTRTRLGIDEADVLANEIADLIEDARSRAI